MTTVRHASLVDICCPVCASALRIAEANSKGDSIVEGSLQCTGCLAVYPIRRGIPHLLPSDQADASKLQEAQGWVNLWEKRGMYDKPTLEDSFRLPYIGGIWTEIARMFEMALQEMNLQGDEVVLDLGAGQGWASRHFAERGCRVFAVDLVADEWYGLGRSWAIMEHAGVRFEPVLASGASLPFFPGRFDIVFLCGVLHHFEEFDSVLREVCKVLKPGGLFVAAAEPSLSIIARERNVRATLEEEKEGITERRPKVFQYWWALKRAGFRNIRIDTFETYSASPSQIRRWIVACTQSFCQRLGLQCTVLVRFACRWLPLLRSRWVRGALLNLCGGTLLLRAGKSP